MFVFKCASIILFIFTILINFTIAIVSWDVLTIKANHFVNKTPGMLYVVLVCMQNCLCIFKINLIGQFFKS